MRAIYKTQKLILLSIVFIFCSFSYASGQDYAGPDKHICLGTGAQIGNDPVAGACYSWTPETGLSDPHIANPIATPTETTVYTVNVVGPNFNFTATDQVTVFVDSTISGVTVKAKQCCWKVGDEFTRDQFDIITNPPGLESQITNITFVPSEAPGIGFTGTQTANVTVTMTTNCGGTNQEFTADVPVTVVNEDFEISYSESLELAGIDQVEELLKKVMKVLKFVPVCEPGASLNVGGSISKSYLCCVDEGGCVKVKDEVSGSVEASADITCDFPLPPIPVLNIRVTGGAGLEGSVSYATECKENQLCFTLQGSATIGGGLSAGNENILEASLMLVGTITFPPIKYCTPPGKLEVPGEFCFSLEVVGSVEYFSLYTQEISFTLISDACMTLW